jgi:hypothetical protein
LGHRRPRAASSSRRERAFGASVCGRGF